jgi:hypothetical protein
MKVRGRLFVRIRQRTSTLSALHKDIRSLPFHAVAVLLREPDVDIERNLDVMSAYDNSIREASTPTSRKTWDDRGSRSSRQDDHRPFGELSVLNVQ